MNEKVKFYTNNKLDLIPQLEELTKEQKFEIYVLSLIFPFRTNNYVMDYLIDWTDIPDDPIFRLIFPHVDMLQEKDFLRLADAVKKNVSKKELDQIRKEIWFKLNPHPAGQLEQNVPKLNGKSIKGVQHKYKETCLIFPQSGQTCHSYCTFCFRWPQFIGLSDLKFATNTLEDFFEYVKVQKGLTNILITGGDPMVMTAEKLSQIILPMLNNSDYSHIQFIRIGTKFLTYYPHRVLFDKDSDDLLRLFEKVNQSGKHLSIMAHFNHFIELKPELTRRAINRILETGSNIRTQAPILNHINASSKVWEKMWREQTRLGCIPYYMFLERDTGAHHYFSVSLEKAFNIFLKAFSKVSGLARTVRGPSMSASPGKIVVDGIVKIQDELVYALSFIQARNPEHLKHPFYAKFNPKATWISDLKPAFGEDKFFFE